MGILSYELSYAFKALRMSTESVALPLYRQVNIPNISQNIVGKKAFFFIKGEGLEGGTKS
jgi:hypothetical protein